MPKIVNQPIVLINTPTGPSNVKNPLLLYRFQQFPLNATLFPDDPGLSFLDQDLSQDPTTLRSPCNGTSEPNSADGNLASLGLQEAIVSNTQRFFLKSEGVAK
jgi:tyrosinase